MSVSFSVFLSVMKSCITECKKIRSPQATPVVPFNAENHGLFKSAVTFPNKWPFINRQAESWHQTPVCPSPAETLREKNYFTNHTEDTKFGLTWTLTSWRNPKFSFSSFLQKSHRNLGTLILLPSSFIYRTGFHFPSSIPIRTAEIGSSAVSWNYLTSLGWNKCPLWKN